MESSSWVAVEASTDRRARARELSRIHSDAVGGASPAGLREPISLSWRRCTSAGVDPEQGTAPIECSADEAAERWRTHPLSIAEPILRELLADVRSDDDQVVLACDADGSLLWIDGEPAVLDAGHEIHLEPGALWSESAAGTNAMGTALAVDHPIQVFSAEHFTIPVHGWTCCAAPVHDPETGRCLGVIDLSGEVTTAHPHSLALVTAAARVVEAELGRRVEREHERLRAFWQARLSRRRLATAVLSSAGTVVLTTPDRWIDGLIDVPEGGGAVSLPEGGEAISEPLPRGEGFLVWRAGSPAPGASPTSSLKTLSVRALGRARAGVGGAELSPRHSEIVVLLALEPGGMAPDRLARELYGEDGIAVTARAELSRLRRILGEHLPRGGNGLYGPLDADFLAVGELLREGRVKDALERYAGPLLPGSVVPAIVEARERLDLELRRACLGEGSPGLLAGWLETPSGRNDIEASRALVRVLSDDDPGAPAAVSRLRRLSREVDRHT